MMASIPNMRSTALPVAAGKAGAADTAPGDFAAQMPALPVAPGEALMPVPEISGEPILPSLPPEGGEGEAEAFETKAETPTGDQPAPAAVVIPFLPVHQATPSPLVPPAVATDETVPPQLPEAVAKAATARTARAPGEAGTAKTGLPLPPAAETAKAEQPAEASQVEAAVKALLQRKQLPAKTAAPLPKGAAADPARPEAAPLVQDQAQPQMKTQKQGQAPLPAAPAPAQAATPLVAAEQAPPVLAPAAPLPVAARTEGPATVEGMRTADLAVERQLDLARDNQWLDRLARDIARAGSTDTPLRFRLHPQTLGHLQVELQQGDHGTAVRLTVETEAARQLLADAQPRLAAEARAQGVKIVETHVDLSGSGRHAPGDQRRQDEARQTPFIRTAHGAGEDAAASPRSSRRAGLDRYA